MKIKFATLLLILTASSALAQTSVTGAGAARFASGAVLNGVTLSSLRFGIGVSIAADGTASGSCQSTLSGASLKILVVGNVTSGSSSALTPPVFSGTCAIDFGDGTTATGVPFAVSVIKDASGTSALALTIGSTALPNATVSAGSITTQ
jgi:hypothetical protein